MMLRVTLTAALLASLATGGCIEGLVGAHVGPRDYLRDDDFTTWVIEVDYAEGERPTDAVLSLLADRMRAVVNKPDGVEVRLDEQLARDERVWTQGSLEALRSRHGQAETGGHTVVTHLSFVAGSFEGESDGLVLGVTIGHEQVVIFSQAARDACTVASLPPCLYADDDILRAVVVHEFGHVLGLVNNGIPMQTDHQDEAHGAHSDNPDSVMYWAVETTDFFRFFTDGLPTQFDADDRADMRAAGGR